MRIITPTTLTIESALVIANVAIADVVGEDGYELCRRYHEEGQSMRTLATRYGISRQRVWQRISATHTSLRRLSIKCGISLMPPAWERQPKAAKTTRPTPVAARW